MAAHQLGAAVLYTVEESFKVMRIGRNALAAKVSGNM
ncbi:hypothetical protein BBR47_00070 [Brevibacillus brevis NBRC 100599]|uniref:Uncharacterized protein n=1 Tax=Brevibacillus brevis (strain 47 / JCM 6285 / NBRC 100599) TaxID=358681 RepID=C0ZH43_BREBN|nr:hypothetical protein BBR47_00070 [Brevibacillus brevis NBRC 100599]